MNPNNKIRQRKRHSFFYITEDPPIDPVLTKAHNNTRVHMPRIHPFFFIDFTDNCTLRQMTKFNSDNAAEAERLKIEKYGRSIITNLEDSSAGEQKLLKFQQQNFKLRQKKQQIRSKINRQLEKSKEKKRSCSEFALKQRLIDQYVSPIAIDRDKQLTRRDAIDSRLESQQQVVLKRLGLYHEQ